MNRNDHHLVDSIAEKVASCTIKLESSIESRHGGNRRGWSISRAIHECAWTCTGYTDSGDDVGGSLVEHTTRQRKNIGGRRIYIIPDLCGACCCDLGVRSGEVPPPCCDTIGRHTTKYAVVDEIIVSEKRCPAIQNVRIVAEARSFGIVAVALSIGQDRCGNDQEKSKATSVHIEASLEKMSIGAR
jgi:hypothetical protein